MNRTCLGLDERFVPRWGCRFVAAVGMPVRAPVGMQVWLPVKMKGRSVALSDHAAAELEDHVPQPIDLTPFDHLQRLEPIEGVIRFLEPIA